MAEDKIILTKRDLVALADYCSYYSQDPLGFVETAFPWGEPGTPLAEQDGADEWQKEVLTYIGDELKHGAKSLGEVIRAAIASGHGIGKALSLDTKIDTPQGRKLFGNLKVGDYVFGADGKPTKIIGTRYYSAAPMYRVQFDDDTACEVSSGHLWKVKGRNDRRKGKDWQIMSTLDIVNAGGTRSNGKARAKQWEIPIQGAVEYPSKKTELAPYLMGVWLGDGCRKKPCYTKTDKEIREKLNNLGYKLSFDRKTYETRILKTSSVKDGVFSLYSYQRYIPADYLFNSADNRRELLSGLLDTDGECSKTGSIIYSTTSWALADDMLWLVRSLGGKAKYQPTNKEGYYIKDGEKVRCKTCYRLTINLPFNPFSIARKAERYVKAEERYTKRWIKSIDPIGNKTCMCIQVAAEDGLFLANDFIATHNSSLVAWLILWAISTFEDTRGVVTANTATQLETKTWAELSKWYNLCITRHLFKWTATSLYSTQAGHEKTWRIDAIPWSKDRPESFAGLHNQNKRILMVYDEASAIDDTIWEVSEGALTDSDTEIIWVAFGNPTRLKGKFHDCFTINRNRWKGKQIDSRTTKMANKRLLNQWVEDYGEDSDFVKVRVRGMFPSSEDLQLIPQEYVDEAVSRYRNLGEESYKFAPVIFGVDPAWSGGDLLVVYLRQGNYSKVLMTIKKNDDDMEVAGKIAQLSDDYHMTAGNIDLGYGQGIYSALKNMGRGDKWALIAFGSTKTEEINVINANGIGSSGTIAIYENKRAEMWYRMRDWLKEGGCIENRPDIINDLTAPNGFINPRDGKYMLESKKDMKARGVQSPNYGDALALTFARPITSGISNQIKYRKARLAGKTRKYGTL